MKSHWTPQKLDRWDALIGAAVVLGTFWLLMATLDIGYTRDESFYFHAAAQYIGWFEDLWKNLWNTNFPGSLAESFSKENIDKHWSYNPEHPVLVKTLFALSHKLFFDKLGWLSESDALRLPGAAFGSMALLCAYAFGRQCFGRLAGLVAVGALLFQPRFFFNAHLTCFDVPIAALWVMVVYAYWRSLESKRWAWVTGILFGLALSAKLNAFFLPIVLCGHWFLLHWRGFGIIRQDPEGDDPATPNEAEKRAWSIGKLRLPPIPWGLVAMAILGPILLHILWPYHWYETWDRVEWYLNFHLKHVHYFVWYFGERLDEPPFPIAYPWVMTLVTVPATLLLTFWFGVWAAMREWRFVDWSRQWIAALRERKLPATRGAQAGFDPRATGLLFAINLIFPIALISMPSTPVFGGTKHWIASMFFLAIFVGAGVSMAVQMALRALNVRQKPEDSDSDPSSAEDSHRPITHALIALILSLAVLGPAAYATWYNHPYGTSYYNELIGSYRGAADAGMMRQYWGYASRQSLPWLNEHAPKNARVWTHNTTGWAWNMYKKDGIVRKDLRPASIKSSQIGIFHHQRAFTWEREKLWTAYGTRAPSYVVDIDGVPLVTVYERPKKTPKRASPKKALPRKLRIKASPQKHGEKDERPQE